MSDKEFLELKNKIKELGSMCRDFNVSFNQLINELSELDINLINFENDIHQLNSDVKDLGVI